MPYTVVRTPLAWIPMRDGIKLAARLWMPELDDNSTDRSEEEQFPAILGENFIRHVVFSRNEAIIRVFSVLSRARCYAINISNLSLFWRMNTGTITGSRTINTGKVQIKFPVLNV